VSGDVALELSRHSTEITGNIVLNVVECVPLYSSMSVPINVERIMGLLLLDLNRSFIASTS
jgi:hypothetical protein